MEEILNDVPAGSNCSRIFLSPLGSSVRLIRPSYKGNGAQKGISLEYIPSLIFQQKAHLDVT